MDPTRKFTPPVHQLIDGMLRMLITYEIELTAYSLVLQKAQENFLHAGVPWDMTSNLRKIIKSSALAIEAEAEYAPFASLLQGLTQDNLAAAMACIQRRMDRHNANIPPDPEQK